MSGKKRGRVKGERKKKRWLFSFWVIEFRGRLNFFGMLVGFSASSLGSCEFLSWRYLD